MPDVDELARRLGALMENLARRGMALATGFALLTLLVGGLSYLTGLAALDGSARSAWTFVGAVMLVIAVGAPLLARWRLSSVLRRTSALASEVSSLIRRDASAQRVVIETIAMEEPIGPASDLRPVVYDSRQLGRLRQVSVHAADLRELPGALRAVTVFPWLLLVALVGILVFGVLGFLFLVALVL